MGIIMQFGASIPLSPAISSGLDSLTQGIAESTKTSGPAGLDQSLDSFSNFGSEIPAWSGGSMPAAGESAAYPSPSQFFSQLNRMMGNNKAFLDIQTHVQDAKFDQPSALNTVASGLFGGQGVVDTLTGKEGLLSEILGGTPGSESMGIIMERKGGIGGAPGSENMGIVLENKLQGAAGAPGSENMGIVLENKLQGAAGGPGGENMGIAIENRPPERRGGGPGSENMGIVIEERNLLGNPQLTNPVATTGVIAPPQLPQTSIDESLSNLTNLNPYTPEGQQNLSIFQQQLEALSGMEGIVKNQVGLNLQFNNLMRGRINT